MGLGGSDEHLHIPVFLGFFLEAKSQRYLEDLTLSEVTSSAS